jgi:hypothetical protein
MINLTKQEIQYLLDSMKAHMDEGHCCDSQNYIGGKGYNIDREDELEKKLRSALV